MKGSYIIINFKKYIVGVNMNNIWYEEKYYENWIIFIDILLYFDYVYLLCLCIVMLLYVYVYCDGWIGNLLKEGMGIYKICFWYVMLKLIRINWRKWKRSFFYDRCCRI